MNKKRVIIFGILAIVVMISFLALRLGFTGRVVEEIQTTTKTYIHAGTLLASKSSDSENVDYYIQDHLGSNRKIINGQMQIEENKYYDFGETTEEQSSGNNYKYTGKELDDETNLYYYGARYYKPEFGRFVQADVLRGDISDPLSLNRYVYVKNNPLKYIDPSGNRIEFYANEESREKIMEDINKLVGEGAVSIKEEEGRYFLEGTDSYKGEYPETYKILKNLIEYRITIQIANTPESRLIGGPTLEYGTFFEGEAEPQIPLSVGEHIAEVSNNFVPSQTLDITKIGGRRVDGKFKNEYSKRVRYSPTGLDIVIYQATSGKEDTSTKPSYYSLAHELGHAYENNFNPESPYKGDIQGELDPTNPRSLGAGVWFENIARKEHNYPLRTIY